MTHYETIGVTESATPDEIKKAYRKLASQHHPDRGGDTTIFQNIQSAYDIISDPNKRQQYDLERSGHGKQQFHWHNFGNGVPADINSIFQQFGFGGDPFNHIKQQQQQSQRRNKDLQVEISIPLVSTLEEQTKVISVLTTTGSRETVEVKIPKGITNGINIKYNNLGDNLFNTIPRGDLYVRINVHNAENFIVNNLDLYTKVSVNCLLAIAGGITTVTGIDDKSFILTIPQGTQPGSKFRIAQQGLYQLNSNIRGNLVVEMNVTVPQDLTSDQLQIVKSILNP
jgi:DnaJ-class molecular chaperone